MKIGGLVSVSALFALAVLVVHGSVGAARAEAFCGEELTLTTIDFTSSGGQNASVEAAANTARLSAEGGAAGSENSSTAELGFRFTPTIDGPVHASFNGILAVGELHGFGNINAGSIRVEAKLRDLTNDVELASVVAVDHSENGAPFTSTIQPVNAIPFVPTEMDVNLTAGVEYAAFIRVRAVANGLQGDSDFRTGNRRVELAGVVLSTDLDDSDGDGLYDFWETQGVDADCDPSNGVDVDLVAMGANPNHKDLFLEIDWMPGAEPTRGMIQALKDAFALAPKDAGGVVNPDNANGIAVHVDAGNLIDPSAAEDGSSNGSCNDGIDNGSDGFADAGDTDCLVGDIAFSDLAAGGGNLGRGNQVPVANITDLGTDQDGDGEVEFYETRNDNFDEKRRRIFRYVMSAPRKGSLLGEAELGGNDVLILLAPETVGCQAPQNGLLPSGAGSATLMHELGHALGLRHGGAPGEPNRKPNFVSIMNYAYAFGIKQDNPQTASDLDGDSVKDCRILDYSPPRVPGGRVSAPIPQSDGILDEDDLDEGKRTDPSDQANHITYFDQTAGQWVDSRIDVAIDWDGDGNTGETGVDSDINNDGDLGVLAGFNDWDTIVLSQLDFDDSETGPVSNLAQAIEVDDGDEILEIYEQTLATDFQIEKQVVSDFAVAGQSLDYDITVTNNGPNRAEFVLTDSFPEDSILLDIPGGCAVSGNQEVSCDPVMLEAGKSMRFELGLRLRADLDCDGAQFLTVTNRAVVESITGKDLDEGNNEAVVSARALCVKYEYAAKFACGEQTSLQPAPLTRGIYATTVNIHNPNDEQVHLFKKVALTYPPAAQKPGNVFPLAIDELGYDEALKTECTEILRKASEIAGNPVPFAEGFVIVQAPRSLDVSGLYSVTTAQTSMHVEQIRERIRQPVEKEPEPREKPDLTPLKYACVPPGPGQGNRPKEIRVFVRNLGPGAAPASITSARFGALAVPDVDTPALANSETTEIGFPIPERCPAACNFTVMADDPESIEETNENNNLLEGQCLPLPG